MRRKKLPVLSARALKVGSVLALPHVASSVTTISARWCGVGWCGEDRLMAVTGLCRSTVRRALKELAPYTTSRPRQSVGRGRPPLVYALTSAGRRALSIPAVAELQARWRETWPELESYYKGSPSPVEVPRG